ncbi:MAG: phage head closure protein [Anaerolineaceae bacterium]
MSGLLSAVQLAELQAVQAMNLPEIAQIRALTKTDDGQGGYSEEFVTRATVNARIGEPKGDKEREVAGKYDVGKTLVITFPVDTELEPDDQIQINGVNYRVHWTNKNKSNMTALRVIVTEA